MSTENLYVSRKYIPATFSAYKRFMFRYTELLQLNALLLFSSNDIETFSDSDTTKVVKA